MARRVKPTGDFIHFGSLSVPDFPSRSVRVYVPRDHQRDGSRPALYMFDGQNIFGDEGSFAGGWFAHEAVDRLRPSTFNVPVVVAIENGGDRRMDELSPWRQGAGGGGADRFIDWLVSDVVALVQRELGVRQGPLGGVVGGSSMGGLAALYAHFCRPDVFGGALCMSPAFFFGRGRLFSFVDEQPPPPFSRIYIDCGAKEGGGRMMGVARDMAKKLESRGYSQEQLMWRPDSRGAHNERHWRRRLPKALRFMFKR